MTAALLSSAVTCGLKGSKLRLSAAGGCLLTATHCVKMLSLPASMATEVYFYLWHLEGHPTTTLHCHSLPRLHQQSFQMLVSLYFVWYSYFRSHHDKLTSDNCTASDATEQHSFCLYILRENGTLWAPGIFCRIRGPQKRVHSLSWYVNEGATLSRFLSHPLHVYYYDMLVIMVGPDQYGIFLGQCQYQYYGARKFWYLIYQSIYIWTYGCVKKLIGQYIAIYIYF